MPRDLRTSGISEQTSMSGRGCGILRVGFHERVLGHGGVPGKRGPTWNKTLSLVLGLICNLSPKTEWPCVELHTTMDLLCDAPTTVVLTPDTASEQSFLPEPAALRDS